MKMFFIYVGVLIIIGITIFMVTRNTASNTPAQVPVVEGTSPARTAELRTNFGVITLELFPDEAPKTVENFATLAGKGFYNGTKFHRVIKDFMIQGGDPNSKDDDWSNDGKGGPGYTFADEFNEHKVVRGALAMANTGLPVSNGSQFFIVTAEAAPWLDGKHTVFGRVTAGMDVVDRIEAVAVNTDAHPLKDVIVESIVVQ